ncbi:hypothetical protein Mapa_007262 [Marchantia paleacea]|nr:hypothetical protein Mapa_007262 [Marchantia paleacea]
MACGFVECRFCEVDSLEPLLVAGNVVICEMNGSLSDARSMESEVLRAGGTGVVIVGPRQMFAFDSGYAYSFLSSVFTTPIPAVGIFDRTAIDSYLSLCNSNKSPTCPSTGIIRQPRIAFTEEKDPIIGTFSSRGPNALAPDILKRDCPSANTEIATAEVIEILPNSVSGALTKFNLISGTSMSCPHVSGVAALVKSVHPDWSPAAVRSALMTTAIPLKRGNVLDYGAGEINVLKAADPGLIYDLIPQDYALYLCGLQYNNLQFEQITGQPISICPNTTTSRNYPSISMSVLVSDSSVVRTVTNVGAANSTYDATIVNPGPDMVVSVSPSTLVFTKINEKLSFTVSVSISSTHQAVFLEHYQGSITWTDSTAEHQVYSPVLLANF